MTNQLSDIEITILALAKKGVLGVDICRKLNISKEKLQEHIDILKAYFNVYKEESSKEGKVM